MINPLFNNSGTRQSLRARAAIRVAARKELNRITSESLTSLRSNFKSADELEETIKKLEKQITTTPSNKTRLVGARKRVSNMRTPLARGGGFRRAGLIAMAATRNNNGLVSHPFELDNKEARKKAAKNITAGAIASVIKKNKETENRRAKERVEFINRRAALNKKKYKKLIENGDKISNSDRERIKLLYNNLAKELNKRNAANKKAALLAARRKANTNILEKRRIAVELASEQEKSANRASREERNKAVKNAKTAANKEASEAAKKLATGAIASVIKQHENTAKRMELEKVLTRLEKLNTPYAIKLYNTISNNDKRILNNNTNLSNRYKSIKQQINNAKAGEKMGAFVQELSTQPPLKQKRPSIFNRGKAFLAARANKKPPPPSFNEAAARNALKRYLNATVKPKYNKALVNAILRLPKENLNNNTRRRLQAPRMYALQRGAGALGRGAVTAGGVLGRGAVTAGGVLGRGAVTAGGVLGRSAVTAGRGVGGFFSRSAAPAAAVPAGRGVGGFFSSFFARKPAGPPSFIPSEEAGEIPLGYVFKKNKQGTGYYKNKNNKALAYGPAPKPVSSSTTGVSVGVGPGPRNRNRYGNRYENNYGYGNNRGGPGGPWGPGGGIVFKPQITVGAARIGAQTFGGTRVGGQQMGGSRLRGGNTGSTTLKTGNTQVSNVGKLSNAGKVANSGTASNAGRLAVSAPTSSGNRQLAATSEQLIRGAGGAEAVEQGIKALKAANGNVNRAKAASRLPNKTFTNIYAMGGPVAAKRLVQIRRRRRTVGGRRVGTGTRGAPGKKKRVAPKPRKQYIKLTPYQFRRLTDHIKKNNLRKVLIKEITH